MSALPAQSIPAPRRAIDRLRVLRPASEVARRAKPRLAYAIIAVAGVAMIIVAQMLLSIAVTQGAYEVDAFQIAQSKLARQEQQLREDLDRVQSPQYLAANAEALGMVPNADPVYLRLSDGAVLGQPVCSRRRRPVDRAARSECTDRRRAARHRAADGGDSDTGEHAGCGRQCGRGHSRPGAGTATRRRRTADSRDALTTENEHEPDEQGTRSG